MSERKAETGALVTGGLAGVLATDQQRKNAMFIDQERSKFEGVVKAYSAELYRYAYWLCRDRFTAEDLVQETFTRAWQGWGGLRDDRAAKGWLYTILRNEHARLHERKQLAIDPDQDLDELMDNSGANAFDAFEMRDMLATLPETYREPLMLQVIGGFGCAEIATMIGITEGAVMTRLTRARQALRRLILKTAVEPPMNADERRKNKVV